MNKQPPSSLDVLIYGMLKFRRLKERRAELTPIRFASWERNLLAEDLEDLSTREWDTEIEHAAMDRKRRLFLAYLAEFTSDLQYRALIQRRLLNGESLIGLSEELGIGYSNARSKVHRFLAYLGLKETSQQDG